MTRNPIMAALSAAFAFVLFPALAAFGQSAADIRSARAQCMALPSDSERLACLNTALDRMETGLEDRAPEPAPVALPAMELGAEQVEARQSGSSVSERAPRETLHAAIIAAQEPIPGQMVLELDNGQVWRQIDGDARALRSIRGSTPVEITRARLGGYRMTLLDQRQMLRVERLR